MVQQFHEGTLGTFSLFHLLTFLFHLKICLKRYNLAPVTAGPFKVEEENQNKNLANEKLTSASSTLHGKCCMAEMIY